MFDPHLIYLEIIILRNINEILNIPISFQSLNSIPKYINKMNIFVKNYSKFHF